MFRVQMDAFQFGRRCLKPAPITGICDLCWYLDGTSTPENISHILMDCPHASPCIAAHRLLISNCAPPQGQREAAGMPRQVFITTFARRICHGCIDFEPAHFHCPPEVVVTLTGAIQQCLLQRRNSNAHPIPGNPPESSHILLLDRIHTRFALAASASHAKAMSSDKRLRIY